MRCACSPCPGSVYLVCTLADFPGSGHCKVLEPMWGQLVGAVGAYTNILTVNCVKGKAENALCEAEDVIGFPTLTLYQCGHRNGTSYMGNRTFTAIRDFIHNEVRCVRSAGAVWQHAIRTCASAV